MRPRITDDTLDEVQHRIRGEVPLPPDRLTVEEQVQVLLERYDDQNQELQRLRRQTNF
jgi:hypothetical protein